MNISRRQWCQLSGAALAVALDRPRWRARRELRVLDAANDPRANLRGWRGLGLAPVRGADLLREQGPLWLAVPAEAPLDQRLAAHLACRLRAGGAVIWEAPSLAGRQELLAVWRTLGGIAASAPPLNLFQTPQSSPYLRLRLGRERWWLRHDSEAVAVIPAGSAGFISGDDGAIYGVWRAWGRGRIACCGTRLGAPLDRNDLAARQWVRAFFAV